MDANPKGKAVIGDSGTTVVSRPVRGYEVPFIDLHPDIGPDLHVVRVEGAIAERQGELRFRLQGVGPAVGVVAVHVIGLERQHSAKIGYPTISIPESNVNQRPVVVPEIILGIKTDYPVQMVPRRDQVALAAPLIVSNGQV